MLSNIAILTSGNDCPGLNAAIRAAVRTARHDGVRIWGVRNGFKGLLKVPVFWLAIVLMVCAGASELTMAQWASAYAESAIGLSKTAGDLSGPCLFAAAMGISRVLYGKYGEGIALTGFMLGSGLLCLVCYLTASLSGNPVIGLVGCIVCGFSVGTLWPGTISISSGRDAYLRAGGRFGRGGGAGEQLPQSAGAQGSALLWRAGSHW